MKRSRIVVGVDGSLGARSALLWAADECRIRRTSLLVVHAPDPADAALVGKHGEAALRAIEEFGARMLSELVAIASSRQPGVPVASLLSHSHARDALIELSAEADIVVVGTRGGGGVVASILGSVSHRIAAHASCPVVIVPQSAPIPPSANAAASNATASDARNGSSNARNGSSNARNGSSNARNGSSNAAHSIATPSIATNGSSKVPQSDRAYVAVGVSHSAAGLAALGFAFEEARLRAVPLIAVRAFGDPGGSADLPAAAQELSRQQAAGMLNRDLDQFRLRFPDVDVTPRLRRIDAIAALLELAPKAQLLVVGCHHSQDRWSTRLGPVPSAVTLAADCPVSIVGTHVVAEAERHLAGDIPVPLT